VTLTVLFALASALCWGAPDVWLAQATRSVGPFAVLFGSVAIGFAAMVPAAFFVETPEWTTRGVLLAILVGALSPLAYLLGYRAFRDGSVSVVAPIIACEGGVAALFALAAGERLNSAVAALLPVAVVGVALAAMGRGSGKGSILPAMACALIWGGLLVLTARVADDLGVFWGFLLIRATALAVISPIALRTGAARSWTGDRWRVAAWAAGDTGGYLLFVAAADRGPVAVAGVLAAQFATVAVIAGLLSGERLRRRQQFGIALVIAAVSGIAATGSA
jgi:drug/metabolite transporter (DMT)-like permease